MPVCCLVQNESWSQCWAHGHQTFALLSRELDCLAMIIYSPWSISQDKCTLVPRVSSKGCLRLYMELYTQTHTHILRGKRYQHNAHRPKFVGFYLVFFLPSVSSHPSLLEVTSVVFIRMTVLALFNILFVLCIVIGPLLEARGGKITPI